MADENSRHGLAVREVVWGTVGKGGSGSDVWIHHPLMGEPSGCPESVRKQGGSDRYRLAPDRGCAGNLLHGV